MKKLHAIIITALGLLLFFPTNSLAASYTDVQKDHWAYNAISKLTSENILTGFPDGAFKPNKPLTRSQAAKILARALNPDLEEEYTLHFEDISNKHSAYKEIRALTRLGVFNNSTQFNPNSPLTRAQMAKIIIEGYNIKVDSNHLISYKDVPDNPYLPYITTLAELGITSATVHYNPNDAVTRSQMAGFIDRSMTFDQKRNAGIIVYDPTLEMYVDKSQIISEQTKEVVNLVNSERKKAGLSSLKFDEQLSQIATIKAKEMVELDYFEHISPTYGEPWDMADRFGYVYKAFGENIAFNYITPAAVMNGWMNSPGHKANILHKTYTNIGIGIAKDEKGQIYWVQMFSAK